MISKSHRTEWVLPVSFSWTIIILLSIHLSNIDNARDGFIRLSLPISDSLLPSLSAYYAVPKTNFSSNPHGHYSLCRFQYYGNSMSTFQVLFGSDIEPNRGPSSDDVPRSKKKNPKNVCTCVKCVTSRSKAKHNHCLFKILPFYNCFESDVDFDETACALTIHLRN